MTAREYDDRDGDNADREEICRRCDRPESECVCELFDDEDEDDDELYDEWFDYEDDEDDELTEDQ